MVGRKILKEMMTKRWTILNSVGLVMLVGSLFLILEHYFKWGALDLTDFPLGHEYTTLFMFIVGFLLISKQANNLFKKLIKR